MKAKIVEGSERVTLRIGEFEVWCSACESQTEIMREIARRVNAHEGLVAALDDLLRVSSHTLSQQVDIVTDRDGNVSAKARAALAIARGEVPG